MPELTMPCTCCGTLLTFPEEAAVRDCPACGTRNARPQSCGDTLQILQRAVEQRLACDFHNAELSYQQVLLFRPDEHEALWGRLLCHYGVEFVEDPATHRRMPTVRTVRPKPLQAQPDFLAACKCAPAPVRAQYELDAAYIDDAQANIRQLAKSAQPYDVFLCHKATKPGSSEKTEDFHRATQLYHFLKDQGVRVFFAPESLQSAAGANYEAGIYHALQTAKVMLVICSNAEYLTSAWVRSEWTRFMELAESEPERQLIPLLYDHFDPASLPPQFLFLHLQGLDMSSITAPQTLTNLLKKVLALETQPEPKSKPEPKPKPERKPKPEQKPEPQPPAEPESCIKVTFPERLPAWERMPSSKVKWFKYKLYKKGQKEPVSEILWGETIDVAAKDGDVLYMQDRKAATLCSVLCWAFLVLGIVLTIFGAILMSADSDDVVLLILGMYFLIVFDPVFFLCIRRAYSLPITITPCKHYEISWNWLKTNVKVKQY